MLVTVIGDLVEDVVVWRSGPIVAGTDNPSTVRRSRGGSAANVAAAAAAGGVPVRFVGRVGEDAAGDRLVAELERDGVEVRAQRGGGTGCVVVLVDADGERTMFPDRGAAADLGPIDAGDLVDTTVLHVPLYGFLDTSSRSHVEAAMHAAAAAGARLSVDLSATSAIHQLGPDRVRAMLAEHRPALVFANAAEADAAGLASMVPSGAFVIKDGPRPACIVHHDGTREQVAPASVETVRDTTGAGDRFAGAFLARWAAGGVLTDACAAGHRAAASDLGRSGA